MNQNSIWILVEVRSGIPLSAKAFTEKGLAETEERKVRVQLNLENDETGIFKIELSKEKIYAQLTSH